MIPAWAAPRLNKEAIRHADMYHLLRVWCQCSASWLKRVSRFELRIARNVVGRCRGGKPVLVTELCSLNDSSVHQTLSRLIGNEDSNGAFSRCRIPCNLNGIPNSSGMVFTRLLLCQTPSQDRSYPFFLFYRRTETQAHSSQSR